MKKSGIILVNPYYYGNDIAYLVERLKQEFNNYRVEIVVKKCSEVNSYLEYGQVKVKDSPYDFVIYLDKDKYLGQLLEKAGYRLFNSATGIELCDDKMKSYLYLANQGIVMPTTIPAPLCFSPVDVDEEFLTKVANILKFPLIIKAAYGSGGNYVYLVNNIDELRERAQALIRKPHLFQEYVASSHGQDVRVIVINKKACAWMLRKSTDDFRSNLANGAQAYKIDLPVSFREMAERVAELLALDYCGVDILIGENNQPIFCEVNSNAFITGIEQTTGINIAKIYCQHIMNEIYQGF